MSEELINSENKAGFVTVVDMAFVYFLLSFGFCVVLVFSALAGLCILLGASF